MTCALLFSMMGSGPLGATGVAGDNEITAEAQQNRITITGKVVDEQNEPLIGVSVMEKGSTTGTASDLDGRYTLQVSGRQAVIHMTYLGYKTVEFTVGSQTTFTTQLIEDTQMIDAVIVTAYGVTKKSSFTGSASVVDTEKLQALQPSNITQGLQGLSAGVQVINNSGRPGEDGMIVIRGLGSMTANSNPLYVIDGVPSDVPLNSLSYSDIESITVLKDAASTSLYGSRAGNGVILITTKKGKAGKTTINVRATWSTSDFAVKFPEKVSASKQWELSFEGLYNDAIDFLDYNDAAARQYAHDNVSRVYWNSTPYTDHNGTKRNFKSGWNMDYPVGLDGKIKPEAKRLWEEDIFGQAFSHRLKQDYGIDMSGALGDKNNYFVSFSMLDDKGVFLTDHFKRFTGRAVLNTTVNKWLSIDNSIMYTSSTNYNGGFAARVFRTLPSEYSAYLWDHEKNEYAINQYSQKKAIDEGWYNGRAWWPRWSAFGSLSEAVKNWNDNVQTVSGATFNILPELTFKTVYSYQLQSWYYNNWRSPAREDQLVASEGSVDRSAYRNTSHTFSNVLNYDKTFEDHHVSVLLGQEAYKYTTNGFGAYRKGLDLVSFKEISLASEDPTAWSGGDSYALLSYFGRLNYDYKDRYYISGSLRSDGSSRFDVDNRWGTFWSVGASWRLTQESFMESTSSWLNNLKLKASYGEVGNDNVGYYPYMGLYTPSNASYSGRFGVVQDQLANPGITWETNIQSNAGIEFALFDRLNGSFEVFKRKSKNLLLARPLAPSTGMQSIMENIGDIQNVGWEIDLNYQAIKTKDFDWTINLNATHYKNEITRLPSKEETFNVGVAYFKWKEGSSRYDMYAPLWADVNPDNGRNRWWKQTFDTNGNVTGREKTENYNEVNTDQQRMNVGSTLPDVYGSLTNSFRYKGIDLSFMLYYSIGGIAYDYNYGESSVLRENFAAYDVLDDRWQKPGDITNVAKIYTYQCFNASSYARYSDKFVFNNDYLRLRNVIIGYTIPKAITNKLGMNTLRLYFKGDNLFTVGAMAKHGSDPENFSAANNGKNIAGGVVDGDSGVPTLKTYNFGINIQF